MMQEDVEDVVRLAEVLQAIEDGDDGAAGMRVELRITRKHSGADVHCDHRFRLTELAWQLNTVISEAFMWRALVKTARAIHGQEE